MLATSSTAPTRFRGSTATCQEHDRRDPAPAPGPGTQEGGDRFFGEPAPFDRRHHAVRPRGARRRQRAGGRRADAQPAPLRDVPPVGLLSELFESCRRRATSTSRSSCSSSTRRTSSSRRAEGAGRPHRAGGAPHPLEGVGVFFVTQNPLDLPEKVLAQLGNRIQHALRAYSPREQKAVRRGRDVPREPGLRQRHGHHRARHRRGAGLRAGGGRRAEHRRERVKIRPPAGRVGPITDAERAELMRMSPVAGR